MKISLNNLDIGPSLVLPPSPSSSPSDLFKHFPPPSPSRFPPPSPSRPLLPPASPSRSALYGSVTSLHPPPSPVLVLPPGSPSLTPPSPSRSSLCEFDPSFITWATSSNQDACFILHEKRKRAISVSSTTPSPDPSSIISINNCTTTSSPSTACPPLSPSLPASVSLSSSSPSSPDLQRPPTKVARIGASLPEDDGASSSDPLLSDASTAEPEPFADLQSSFDIPASGYVLHDADASSSCTAYQQACDEDDDDDDDDDDEVSASSPLDHRSNSHVDGPTSDAFEMTSSTSSTGSSSSNSSSYDNLNVDCADDDIDVIQQFQEEDVDLCVVVNDALGQDEVRVVVDYSSSRRVSSPCIVVASETPINSNMPSSSVSDDDQMGVREVEEREEFSPYMFIRNLPSRDSLTPASLAPRQSPFLPPLLDGDPRVCLVLDLDETLVHCSTEPLSQPDLVFPVTFNSLEYTVFARKRPFIHEFLARVASRFEVVVFTASQEVYADKLLNILDPEGKFVRHRLFRDSCLCVEGNYIKDLSLLGRDLSKVVIVDNSPQAFGYHVENGIPIASWFEDKSDQELLSVCAFLEESLLDSVDVRDVLREKYNLRKLVAGQS